MPATARVRPAPAGGSAAVVHPYSTGRYLPEVLASHGWQAVAVVPSCPLAYHDHAASFQRSCWRSVVTDSGDLSVTAQALARAGVTAVLAGTESGVELADALAGRLGLPGNDPLTSSTRRDKGLMAAALKRAGLASTRTLRAGSADEAAEAAAVIGGPVVVKPAGAAGSEDVTVCRTPGQVRAAWRSAAGRQNILGAVNAGLLVQEYLQGRQYTVNTVSVAGAGGRAAHFVAEVWLDRRREAGGPVIYDRQDLLPADHPGARAAGTYVCGALDALGVRTGPAHSEVIAVAGRGPVLVEVNARLAGMIDVTAMRQALGASHVDLAVEALADPAGFARARAGSSYRQLAYAVHLDLAADRPGILDPAVLAAMRALPAVAGWVCHVAPGEPVVRTVNLLTSPGRFILVGSRADVEADASAIREMEAGLYR